MKHQHACTSGKFVFDIIPPYILESIAKNGNEEQRESALRTLHQDRQVRSKRREALENKEKEPETPANQERTEENRERRPEAAAVTPRKNRLIYNANNTTTLPGTLARKEGQAAVKDVAVNEAYDGFGATFDLFWDIFKRNSIDDKGMDMVGTVHYDISYNNAYWDENHMVFGDGDNSIFVRFTIAIDIMGHELSHGVVQHTAGLEYNNQSGALNESVADVFGALVKQRKLNQTAAQADWLIGQGLLAPGRTGVALRSMKAPGTAYDDWLLGKDPQPDHMSKYNPTTDDNGGVHINSGIPNKAFYLAAVGIGGKAWEKAGMIWYRTLVDPRLSSTASFQEFADLTVDNAGKLYDDVVQAAVAKAWKGVGINVVIPEAPTKQFTVAHNKDGRMILFSVGSDGALYHNTQVAVNGANWSGWKSLGGKLKQFTVSQNLDGRLEVFYVDPKNSFYHNWQLAVNGATWSGWKPLGALALKSIDVQDQAEQAEELLTDQADRLYE